MKVVFLDVDGVLASDEYFEKIANQNIQGIESEIDVEKVKLLKKIIDETGAKIVLDSTWRYMRKVLALKELLSHYGISIMDSTPFLENERELEIKAWLSNHPEVEDFVIIDDEDFNFYEQGLIEKLIKTSRNIDGEGYSIADGLLPKDVDEIIKRFGRLKDKNSEEFER